MRLLFCSLLFKRATRKNKPNGVRDRPWLPWPSAADEADVLLHKIVVLLGPCQSVTGFYGQLRVALVIHYATIFGVLGPERGAMPPLT